MLFLITVLLLAAGLFYWAAENAHHGLVWADRVCNQAAVLCDNPWWLMTAAGILVALSLARRALRA